MYKNILGFIVLLSIGFIELALSQQQERFNTKSKTKIIADAGRDVLMPSGSIILLDASNSIPKNQRYSYKWSFPPNFIFDDDYSFNAYDTIEYYEPESKKFKSIKSIKTQTKTIEMEIPFKTPGSKFLIGLKIENKEGETSEDVLNITIDKPIENLFNIAFSKNAVQELEQRINYLTYFIDREYNQFHIMNGLEIVNNQRPNQIQLQKDFLSIQPIKNPNLDTLQIRMINQIIFEHCKNLGIKNILNPNRKILKEFEIRKELDKNILHSDTLIFTTDKTPRLKKWLKIFESEKDTSVESDLLQSNLKQSKNQFDPKTGEMVNNVNTKDSVLIKKEPFIQLNPETAEALSKIASRLKRIFLPTSWVLDNSDSTSKRTLELANLSVDKQNIDLNVEKVILEPEINYIVTDTIVSEDTLFYNEIKKITLKYNFETVNDSVAVENALLEGVGLLLTWSLNNSNEFVFNFYDISQRIEQNPLWIWETQSSNYVSDLNYLVGPTSAMLINEESSELSIKINSDSTKVYLSEDISAALGEVLSKRIQKNKNLVDRTRDINQRAMVEIKKRPIVFALSLATLTQGIRSLINRDDKDKDLPPVFPPI